jgi:hypothetical protein
MFDDSTTDDYDIWKDEQVKLEYEKRDKEYKK